ncbi:hypothetical protein ACFX2F_017027 [Malus domestica]
MLQSMRLLGEFELGQHLGKEVGFQSAFLLKKYSVINLDEVHVRSYTTDILMRMLSRVSIACRRKEYKNQQKLMSSGKTVKSRRSDFSIKACVDECYVASGRLRQNCFATLLS